MGNSWHGRNMDRWWSLIPVGLAVWLMFHISYFEVDQRPTARAIWNLAALNIKQPQQEISVTPEQRKLIEETCKRLKIKPPEIVRKVNFDEAYLLWWIAANYRFAYGEPVIEWSLSDGFNGSLETYSDLKENLLPMTKIGDVKYHQTKYFVSMDLAKRNLNYVRRRFKK